MKVPKLLLVLVPIGLTAASLGALRQTSMFRFVRKYVPNTVSTYDLKMTFPGGVGGATATIKQTVTEAGETPKLKYETVKLDAMGMPGDGQLPTLTSAVSPNGMPDAATVKNAQEFFVFLSAAGMVAGRAVKKDQIFTCHWDNTAKDVAFDGVGSITASDEKAKTITVTWDETMTPANLAPAKFKLKSVYSTDDYSLVSSEGTMTVPGATVTVSAVKK